MLGFGHHNECTGKRTIGKNGQRNTKLSKKLLLWKKLKNTCKDMQNEQDSTKTGKSRAPEVTIKIVTDHYRGRRVSLVVQQRKKYEERYEVNERR